MSHAVRHDAERNPPAKEIVQIRSITDKAAWDAVVWQHPGGNIFSSWMWGEYKARLNWKVERIAITDRGGNPLAHVQYYERKRGLSRLVQIQGGPLLTSRGAQQAETAVKLLLRHLDLGRLDLLAIDYERFESSEAVLALLAQGFVPVVAKHNHTLELDLGQGYEAILRAAVDLGQGYEAILRAAEPQWRNNLRRAEKQAGLTVHFPTATEDRLKSFDAFSAMYGDLKKRKGFRNTFDCDAYRDLAAGDPHQVFVEIRDNDEIVTVRIAHLSADRCTDFFAASSEKARRSGAATLSVSRLVQYAIAQGCKAFDFGGIDPSGNRGVFDFKRKLSRQVVQTGPLLALRPHTPCCEVWQAPIWRSIKETAGFRRET